ncbi:MAG TPA: peptide deformylase, partial [Mariniflexile sp.]
MLKNSFSAEQSKMIMSSDSQIPMRVFKITNKKDSLLLRTKSQNIKANPNDVVLQRFVKRLYATVRD